MQPFLLSGDPGANGLIVRQRVEMGPELVVVDAVQMQLLVELTTVLGILQNFKIARNLTV